MKRTGFAQFISEQLLVQLLYLCAASGAASATGEPTIKIQVNPNDVNVSLHGEAKFSCRVSSAESLFWKLNGTFIEALPSVIDKQMVSEGNQELVGNLTIPREGLSSELNNTDVTCMGVSTTVAPYIVTSKPATLMLQGRVGPPNNITAILKNTLLEIYWEKPYTLAGISIPQYKLRANLTHNDIVTVRNTTDVKVTTAAIPIEDTTIFGACEVTVCIEAETEAGIGDEACSSKHEDERVFNFGTTEHSTSSNTQGMPSGAAFGLSENAAGMKWVTSIILLIFSLSL